MGARLPEPCERLEHRVVQGRVLIAAPPVQEDEERPWVSFGGALGQYDGYRKLPGNGFALHLDPFDPGTPLVHRSDDAAGFEHGPGQYERGTDRGDGNDAAAQDQRPGRRARIHRGALATTRPPIRIAIDIEMEFSHRRRKPRDGVASSADG